MRLDKVIKILFVDGSIESSILSLLLLLFNNIVHNNSI